MQEDGLADAYVVVDGTVLPTMDMDKLIASHFESESALTIVASKGHHGNGNGTLTPAGIYVFSPGVLRDVPEFGYQDIKESLIPGLYDRGAKVSTYEVSRDATVRVTGSGSYLGLNLWVIEQKLASEPPAGYRKVGSAWVHASSKIDPSARFVGPVWVGPECVVQSNAIIVGPTSLGRRCHIGREAVISCSILWERCRVGVRSVLDHCVLTDDSYVDPDTGVRKAICLPRKPALNKPNEPHIRPESRSDFFSMEGQGAAPATSELPRQERASC
jgi:NDP-sugar pyrophosphorylase family protein